MLRSDARTKSAKPWIETARPRLRVLIVDDEMLLRWSVAEALRSCGHTVIEASDAVAALRELAHATVDVVLIDYWSSERHNFPFLEIVGAMAPAAAVVLTTAFAIEGLEEQARALGAAALVHKPFDVFGIEPVLQRVCHACDDRQTCRRAAQASGLGGAPEIMRKRSSGSGNTTVVFFSTPISVSVCR